MNYRSYRRLGSSFHSGSPPSRPALYASLKIGDKVVSPFTISCGECEYGRFISPTYIQSLNSPFRFRFRYCRFGFTARCVPHLSLAPCSARCSGPIRPSPLAGGTLFSLSTPSASVGDPLSLPKSCRPYRILPSFYLRTYSDWAFCRPSSPHTSQTCSDLHGHPMAP